MEGAVGAKTRYRLNWLNALPVNQSARMSVPGHLSLAGTCDSIPDAHDARSIFLEGVVALDGEAARKVLSHIDRDELAQLGCELTSIPSPTGQEKAIAEFILAWFEANGIKAVRQEVEVDRPNAVGI